jgi:hypothetical protein
MKEVKEEAKLAKKEADVKETLEKTADAVIKKVDKDDEATDKVVKKGESIDGKTKAAAGEA